MANKGYVYRLYPNKTQQEFINKTIGCSRFIYNHLLADRTEFYKATGKTLKKEVSEYKTEFPFLKEVDSLALANAKRNLEQAFLNFFNKNLKAKYPQFHKKGRNDSYTTNRLTTNKGNSNIELIGKGIKLPKVGVVKIKQHRLIGNNETIKSCTISKKANKYYISILVEYEAPNISKVDPTLTDKVIGFDYSSPLFYVDSNGHSPENIKYYRASEKKLSKTQHKLSKKQKGSKNYNKELFKLQKLHNKIANQRKDFAFKEANTLTKEYDILVFEDLDLANLKRTLNLGKATSDNGFGQFRTLVKQKCEQRGKLFIKLDKWYPSSKTCHCCGYINKELELTDRDWLCPNCGQEIDRDFNAALNIRDEGYRIALAKSK